MTIKNPALAITLVAIVTFTWLLAVYSSSLNGPFLLDDFGNIPQTKIDDLSLKSLGDVATRNQSGSLGRPIPVLTFAFNHYFGDEGTFGFKFVNLLIHFTNTILVYLLVLGISKRLSFLDQKDKSASLQIFAVSIAIFWSLHPLQVSTVAYIVQRMTQLVTLFTLCAFLSYIYGRQRLLDGKTGFPYLLFGVPFFGILACFSKENGVLILPQLFLFEVLLFRFSSTCVSQRNKLLFYQFFYILIPIALISAFIYMNAELFIGGYKLREFTLFERLITEPGVILFYLRQILLPDLASMGLYFDAYPVKSAVDHEVRVAIGVLLAMLVCLFIMARRAPVVSLGFGVFLIGHSMESTVIPLELVFEHRNYLPMLGILLISGWYIRKLIVNYDMRLTGTGFLLVVFSIYSFQVYARANTWSNALTFNSIAVETHPGSFRAHRALSASYVKLGDYDKARKVISAARGFAIDDATIDIDILQLNCHKGRFDLNDYQNTLEALRQAVITNDTISGLLNIATNQKQGYCENPDRFQLLALYNELLENRNIKYSKSALSNLYIGYAGVHLQLNQNEIAEKYLVEAEELNPKNVHILFWLAELQIRVGRTAAAMEVISRLSEINGRRLGIYTDQIRSINAKLDRALLGTVE